MRNFTWPELERLARFVRAADSLPDTLATWTGRGVDVEIVRCVDRVFPDATVAESLALHEGARVQEREVRMRCGELVVLHARSSVAVDSAAFTPAVRQRLRAGAPLEDLLRTLPSRRVVVRAVAQRGTPTQDPGAPALAVQSRFDVAGTPVAWSEETIFEAVFAWDGRGADRAPSRLPRRRVPA
jgi:chorismate-pyruvate lyase